MKKADSTLSAHVRNAWKGEPLEVSNRKKNRLYASEHHISILAHITPAELTKTLGAHSLEAFNGFLNRFLLCCIRRSKVIEPSDGSAIDGFAEPLRNALVKAKAVAKMERSLDAEALWLFHLERLARSKGIGTERARPQTLRLSMLYALLDGSAVIEVPHLQAALALWDYCAGICTVHFRQQRAFASG